MGFLENELRDMYTNTINYHVQPPSNTALTFTEWAYDELDEGNCDAALINYDSYEERSTTHRCDMMFVGKPVLTIYNAWPINPAYANSLSYWFRKLSWPSENAYFMDRHRSRLLPAMDCDPWNQK